MPFLPGSLSIFLMSWPTRGSFIMRSSKCGIFSFKSSIVIQALVPFYSPILAMNWSRVILPSKYLINISFPQFLSTNYNHFCLAKFSYNYSSVTVYFPCFDFLFLFISELIFSANFLKMSDYSASFSSTCMKSWSRPTSSFRISLSASYF